MKKFYRRLDPNTVVLLKHIGLGVVMVSIVALLITLTWYGTRLAPLTISKVEAVGGETIDRSSIVRIAESSLDGTYLGLVPHRFVWLLPVEKIKNDIETIDRVYNVHIERQDTVLTVTFDEYVPDALWCESTLSSHCLFIDAQAYAFSEAPSLTGGTFTRFITTGKEITVGESMVSNEVYAQLLHLEQLLAERDWFVSHIEVDQVGDAYIGVVGGGELKVAMGVPPEKIVENLFTVLSSDQFSHLHPGNFQYIDLRFGNKVFVNEQSTDVDSEVVAEEEVAEE